MKLPKKLCPLGYPMEQVRSLVADMEDFHAWMFGQTGAICEGRRYNYETDEYEPDACADTPHGLVIYQGDLRRYLKQQQDQDYDLYEE